MTYEHLGGTPASPDIDMGLPAVCERCDRDCPEPCEAFKRFVAVANHIENLNRIDFYDPPFVMEFWLWWAEYRKILGDVGQ